MRYALSLLLLCLLQTTVIACNSCNSSSFLQETTLTDPAKYNIIYTGLPGLILDEYVRLTTRSWIDEAFIRYSSGDIDELTLSGTARQILIMLSDYSNGKYSDKRKYWWHYESSWGRHQVYIDGPVGDVINLGPFTINNKFKFKMTDYDVDITNRWHYKLKPSIRFTTTIPFVSNIDINNVFIYKTGNTKVIMCVLGVGVDFVQLGAVVNVNVELINW